MVTKKTTTTARKRRRSPRDSLQASPSQTSSRGLIAANTDLITIESEQSAFRFLEQALANKFEGRNIRLKLKKWPVIEIALTGKGYSSTITADVAESIVDIQRAVNRAYAATVKNHASAIHLTDSEKASLRFKAKVSKGSSIINVDLGPAAQLIANDLVAKMTGNDIIITVLGFAAIWGTTSVVKHLISTRAQGKNVTEQTQHQLAMSQQETERHRITTQALTHNTALAHAKTDFDEVGNKLLKSIGDADAIELNGVKVDRASAYEIARGSRQASRDVQLNGQYMVEEASFKKEDSTKISVRRRQDGKEFTATFQDDSLDGRQLTMLKNAAFAKKPVFLKINGTELRGNITTATILEVSEVDDSL